ncbi:hypothetical protein Hanom_Chr09g00793861 [Helianthus anomalus]
MTIIHTHANIFKVSNPTTTPIKTILLETRRKESQEMSMSMSRLIGGSSLSTTRPSLNFKSFSYNPTSQASFSNDKDHSSYSCHGFSSRSLNYDPMKTIPRKSFIIRNNITPPPGVPLPSGSPSGSM